MNLFLNPLALHRRMEPPPNVVELLPRGQDADDADGFEPLSSVVREIARELEADGVLVVWHEQMREPVRLFWDGDCVPSSTVEHDMIEAASQMARGHPDRALSEWCAPGHGGGGLLTTGIPSDEGVVTVTTMYRKAGGPTRLRVREAAARLLPLVQPFFRLWTMRFKMLSRVRGLTAAINYSDVATLLVNRDGQLLFANDAAEALIAAKDGLRRSGSLLSGTKLADTLRLQAAIEHVVATNEGGTTPARAAPVVALTRERRRPLLAAIVANRAPSAGTGESAAIVYIFDPEQDLRARLEPACKLYGLSPVETKLTCLLADGTSLADAAERMRVREQSARSYLKQIFLKTDTNRQAELVWLMLKSSVRTAAGCPTTFV